MSSVTETTAEQLVKVAQHLIAQGHPKVYLRSARGSTAIWATNKAKDARADRIITVNCPELVTPEGHARWFTPATVIAGVTLCANGFFEDPVEWTERPAAVTQTASAVPTGLGD